MGRAFTHQRYGLGKSEFLGEDGVRKTRNDLVEPIRVDFFRNS